MNRIKLLAFLVALLTTGMAYAWPGMPMPKLHVEGRWLVDEDGNHVNLHGFGQTYSPWFNEMGSKWNNYNVQECLKYNKDILDGVMDRAGWKATYIRMHMDPYWSNTPGVWTSGENDISAFDMRRFQKYLKEVFIPMAEYAISKGLYVVMRPPGVCPEKIAVGDDYHAYLKRVWGYVAQQKALTENPYVMFELANEPVQIKGTDGNYGSGTDACNKALTQFFQEIVDIMRQCGCQNILWVPGSGYQSQYAGFAKYPIKGKNIGYAVHVYPGWYGSDAIEPSHELGGSYGGGYSSFASGWANQIEPCAAIAPMLVTEMDWLPKKYESSWGKSITGKMLGSGFGANFKLLADRTGNVGWMLFTGPELLAQFDGQPGSEGNYTKFNDPEGCMWSGYHWFAEYAGFELPEIQSVDLYLSPRSESVPSECLIQTGSITGAALIADRGLGFDFNVQGDIDVEISNPEILEWDNGVLNARGIGETDCTISYNVNGKEESKTIHFTSTPFPIKNGYFNPSIWADGSFDEATGEFSTGQWGFAGWKFGSGLDLSDYNYLIAEIESPQTNGLSFRVFDVDNYWTDCYIEEFDKSTRAVIDLKNMKLKNGRKLDPSHLYIIGFWSHGGQKFKLKSVFPANDRNAEASVEDIYTADDVVVDVYNMQGVCLRRGVAADEAAHGLPNGLYIIGGKKVMIKN
ncbi:MAG: glycoside hydrolase family 5 protein [Muribaculaceae bacterium]|nr:glycoside hydrolase family 5 protein [Muribaculaceae bacterium]